MTDIRASPDSEGCRRRVLVVSACPCIEKLLTVLNHDRGHG